MKQELRELGTAQTAALEELQRLQACFDFFLCGECFCCCGSLLAPACT